MGLADRPLLLQKNLVREGSDSKQKNVKLTFKLSYSIKKIHIHIDRCALKLDFQPGRAQAWLKINLPLESLCVMWNKIENKTNKFKA